MAVKITETTLRDAHQSLMATRLRTSDILPITEDLDRVGFFSLEACWVIECRINAEDPLNNFAPCPGTLARYCSPGGIGIRVDSDVHTRYTILSYYDPMISKLIIWGRDRQETIERAKQALYEYIIVGVSTNIPFLKAVVNNPSFIKGEMTAHFIEEEQEFFQEMLRIIEQEKSLQEKLETIFNPRRKMAAVAMALKAYRGQA